VSKYLVEVKYTLEGIKGLKAEGGSARVAAAKAAIEEQGGKVEAFYFAFGAADAYVVADMPDNVSAAAVGLIVSSGGGATTNTVVLLSADEMDAAAKRQSSYRPPGG
jgi:uncharacterized protein with GYD domain